MADELAAISMSDALGRGPRASERGIRFIAVLAIALLAPLALLASAAAHAEIQAAELQVNGLTCPFCAFGIEKKLYKVDGVVEVSVDLDEGRIELALSASNHATARAIAEAVEEAGFGLSGLALVVRGTYQPGVSPRLDAGEEVVFGLVESQEPGPPRAPAAVGARVVVSGEVRDWDDSIPVLLVERLERSEG